jgi:hypothetical protein
MVQLGAAGLALVLLRRRRLTFPVSGTVIDRTAPLRLGTIAFLGGSIPWSKPLAESKRPGGRPAHRSGRR